MTMTKPIVFNYQDYVALESQISDLREENDRLKEKVGNLKIRCRIAEEALTESQNNLLQFAMDKTWIPTDEKLPDFNQPVLVCWSDGRMTDGYRWDEDSWFCAWEDRNGWHRKGRDKRIIAWMPLPEPYREEGAK